MYGLNKDTDLSFLKGQEVIQIAIGVFQVQFHFDRDAIISVEGEFQYLSENNSSHWRQGTPEAAAPALRLLGSSIQNVDGKEDGTLDLTFSNGDHLVVRDNSKEYESYTISGGPSGSIVV